MRTDTKSLSLLATRISELILIAIGAASVCMQTVVCHLCIPCQFCTDFTEAELTINLRTIEMQAILLESDALNVGCAATTDKLHTDALLFQCLFQLLPVLATGNGIHKCIVYLIFHGIGPT